MDGGMWKEGVDIGVCPGGVPGGFGRVVLLALQAPWCWLQDAVAPRHRGWVSVDPRLQAGPVPVRARASLPNARNGMNKFNVTTALAKSRQTEHLTRFRADKASHRRLVPKARPN